MMQSFLNFHNLFILQEALPHWQQLKMNDGTSTFQKLCINRLPCGGHGRMDWCLTSIRRYLGWSFKNGYQTPNNRIFFFLKAVALRLAIAGHEKQLLIKYQQPFEGGIKLWSLHLWKIIKMHTTKKEMSSAKHPNKEYKRQFSYTEREI